MQMSEVVKVRLTKQQIDKMEMLVSSTNSNKSKLLRDLIDAAEVVPAQFSVRIPAASGAGRKNERINV